MTCSGEADHVSRPRELEKNIYDICRCSFNVGITLQIFFAGAYIFLQRPPTHAIRFAFDSGASAIEFYIILHKISSETVY